MDVILLGTAGWMPSEGRETACIAVRLGKLLVLLDAGTGLRKLVTAPSVVSGIESIHVLLSHFHLDHVVGLSYLSALPHELAVHISGPGAWLYATPTEEILNVLIGPPYQPYRLRDRSFRVGEIGPQETEIAGKAVHVRAQFRHSAPSVGLRIGDDLAYITDTAYDAGSEQFASGVRVLLHEAFADADGDDGATHSSPAEAARVAAAAGVGQLHLVHVAPHANEDELLRDARREFASVRVGQDDERLVIGRGEQGE